VNHFGRTSLDMSLEDYHALPESVRPLLKRVFAQAMRSRRHEVDRIAPPLEKPGEVSLVEQSQCGRGKSED
jgi:hypothetical protein